MICQSTVLKFSVKRTMISQVTVDGEELSVRVIPGLIISLRDKRHIFAYHADCTIEYHRRLTSSILSTHQSRRP